MNAIFSRIIGHTAVKRRLSVQIERDAVPHALLFYGPRHLGKATLAEAFASVFLDTDRLSTHPDFRAVGRLRDPKTAKLAKRIGIEAIRELRNHLRMTGFLGGRKVAVIDEAERMSDEAANGLLKTLEEPSKGSVIVLIVHELSRVPSTIRSRSALFPFTRVPDALLEEALRERAFPEAEVLRLGRFSAGRPGIALTLEKDRDMLHWYVEQESRWEALRREPLYRRFASLGALAGAKTDREETVRTISDATSLWETLLQRELRSGSRDAVRVLHELAALRAGLDTNVQPRLLLERFALALESAS